MGGQPVLCEVELDASDNDVASALLIPVAEQISDRKLDGTTSSRRFYSFFEEDLLGLRRS